MERVQIIRNISLDYLLYMCCFLTWCTDVMLSPSEIIVFEKTEIKMMPFNLLNKQDWNERRPERKVQNLSKESLNMDLLLPCFMELMNAKPETNIEYFLYSLRNLFTLMESVQVGLSEETWSMIFKGVILPMLDDFIYYSENPFPKLCASETKTFILTIIQFL